MTHKAAISRRTMLRGVGVAMSLPWLEAMGQQAAAKAAPTRMACIFTPNGVNYDAWLKADAAGRFTGTLEAIEPVRRHVNVLTGLTLDRARANGDGPGDHARSSASFLTGQQARKTAGNDLRIGVSVDQFAAEQIGHRTRLPSIAMGCDQGRRAGNCDSGYSCAYSSNISWRDEDTPATKLIDPAAVFRRLFGDGEDRRAAERYHSRRSVLDYVLSESRRLESRLGMDDRRKLDEYQTGVRELERRIRDLQAADESRLAPADTPEPEGIPDLVSEHIDIMYDMLALAFRTDTTRIATFMVGTGGSNRSHPELGISAGHHHLSHHKGDAEMVEQIRRIDRFHVERFARFVQSLADTPEGEGSLLDSCMIVHGSGISDGNRHNHEDLPLLFAGGMNGRAKLGRKIEHGRETPLCGLYLSMLRAMGCDVAEFGDASAPLPIA